MADYECSICRFSNHYNCKCKTDSTDFCNENATFNSLKHINNYVFIYNKNDIANAVNIYDIIKCKYVVAMNIKFNSIISDFTPPLKYIGCNNITGLWKIDSKMLNEYLFDIDVEHEYYGLNICILCFSQFIMNEFNEKKNRTCINRLIDICDNLKYTIEYGHDCDDILDKIKEFLAPLSSSINEVIEVDFENKENNICDEDSEDEPLEDANDNYDMTIDNDDVADIANNKDVTTEPINENEFFTPNLEDILENVITSK